MILYIYVARGKGRQPLGDKLLMSAESPYHFAHLLQVKKIALKSDFIYIFFMFHHMYIAQGRGRQSTGDKILMTTERPFLYAHILQV